MAALSEAVAVTVMVPDSVAPEAGEAMETVSGVGFPPLLPLELLTLPHPALNNAKPKRTISKSDGGGLIPAVSLVVWKPRILLNPQSMAQITGP
jgi:hypothetical protein